MVFFCVFIGRLAKRKGGSGKNLASFFSQTVRFRRMFQYGTGDGSPSGVYFLLIKCIVRPFPAAV
jgi:hypothetical protein